MINLKYLKIIPNFIFYIFLYVFPLIFQNTTITSSKKSKITLKRFCTRTTTIPSCLIKLEIHLNTRLTNFGKFSHHSHTSTSFFLLEEGMTVKSAMCLLTRNENVDQDQIKDKFQMVKAKV
jgi:hypothetical protein